MLYGCLQCEDVFHLPMCAAIQSDSSILMACHANANRDIAPSRSMLWGLSSAPFVTAEVPSSRLCR
jgi:hypothetical protein